MYFSEFKISKDWINNALSTDPDALNRYHKLFIDRRFYVGDTNVSRKTFNIWKKSGLFPYSLNENGWKKLSLIEGCWLNCIKELISLGVSLKKIRELKDHLFDQDVQIIREILIHLVENSTDEVVGKQEALEFMKSPDRTVESMKHDFENLQVSLFSLILISIIMHDLNIYLNYNKSGKTRFTIFETLPDEKINRENQQIILDVLHDSFVSINLRNVITEFLYNESKDRHANFAIEFLNQKEKKIIEKIREKNAKEIIITFSDVMEPTHIYVNRRKIDEKVLNKVAGFLGKGKYKKVQFRTRDGLLLAYEETDIIKI